MPKLKKAVAKKALAKSPKSKVAKPTTAKSKAIKAKAEKPKTVKSKLSKSKPSKIKASSAKDSKKAAKPLKAKHEDAALHHLFVSSLVKLQEFWQKKCVQLKKEVEISRVKYDKVALKQKTAKTTLANVAKTLKVNQSKATQNQHDKALRNHDEAFSHANHAQMTLNQAKEVLANAKRASDKYAALSKMIKQFEGEWLKNIASSPKILEKSIENKPVKALSKKSAPQLQSKVKMVEFDMSDEDFEEDEIFEAHENTFASLENEFQPEENAELTEDYSKE